MRPLFFSFFFLLALTSCVMDPDPEASSLTTASSQKTRTIFQLKATERGSFRALDEENTETAVVTAVIYLYRHDTGRLYCSLYLTQDNLTEIIPPNEGMSATYETIPYELNEGNYDLFVLANYDTYPSDTEASTEDYFKTSKTVFMPKGILTSIPDTGLPMSSRANEHLNVPIQIQPDNNQTYISIDLERIYAKVTLNIGELEYELKNENTTYATVSLSSYWFVNLMKEAYDFRHVARVDESLTSPTSWLFDDGSGNSHFGITPWEETGSSDAGDVYVIDPSFYKKKIPLEEDLLSDLYANNIGLYQSGKELPEFSNFRPTVTGVKPVNVYILENTLYKTSQINAYTPGVLFSASVSPVSFLYWNPLRNQLEEYDAEKTGWTTLYLYQKKFYRDIRSLLKEYPDFPLDESKKDYTDAELAAYDIKRLNNVQGTGVCYYLLWLKHLPDASMLDAMKFGVVRNTHYNLTISGITGIGKSQILIDLHSNVEPNSYADGIQ